MDTSEVIAPTTNPYNSNEPKIINPYLVDEQKINKEAKDPKTFREVANEDPTENLKQN